MAFGAAIPEPAALVQEPIVSVTLKVPAVETTIVAEVSPVDQRKDPVPDAVKIEFPQLFKTVTVGAADPGDGLAIPDPAALVQPPTVCVTV